MCGLLGLFWEKHRRTKQQRLQLLDIFTRLLVLSESRGRHATGVAWIKTGGTYDVFKAPMSASNFIHQPRYTELLAGVDNKTTILMGHTRWRTQGSEKNNANNHPLVLEEPSPRRQRALVAPVTVLTHNGHLSNAGALFRQLHLPRQAEVDSEILAHFAAGAVRNGAWDLDYLRRHLALCRGTMTAVMASTAVPEQVLIAKGNRPLFLLLSQRYRVMLYASDMALLEGALGDDGDWVELRLPPMTLTAFNYNRLTNYRSTPFFLADATNRGRWSCR